MAGEQYGVEIRGRDNVSPALRSVARSAESTTDKVWKFSASLDHITNVAGKVIDVLDAAADAFVGPIEKAIEAERVDARLEQQLRATGNAAGFAMEELDALARSVSGLTAVDDEVVKGAEGILLAYTNLTKKGGVFESALTLSIDLAEAMDKSLAESAKKVGKALNDPVRELSALREEGVVFSREQEEMIKAFDAANNGAAAQAIVIDELTQRFGGAAAAAVDNFGGALLELRNAWDEVQESIGRFVTENQGAEALIRALTGGLVDLSGELRDNDINAQIAAAEMFQVVLLAVVDVVDALVRGLGALAVNLLEVRELFVFDVSDEARAVREESIELYAAFDAQVEILARVGRISETAAREIVRGADDAAAAIVAYQEATGLQTAAAADLVQQTRELHDQHVHLEKQFERMTRPSATLRDGLSAISEEMGKVRDRVAAVDVAGSFDPFAAEVRDAYTEIERLERQLQNLTSAVSPESAAHLLGVAEVVRQEFGGTENLVILEQWSQWLEQLADDARDLALVYAETLLPKIEQGTDAFEETAGALERASRGMARHGSGPGPVAAPDGQVEFGPVSEFDKGPTFDTDAALERIELDARWQQARIQAEEDYWNRVAELEAEWATRAEVLAADVAFTLSDSFVNAASGFEDLSDGMESFLDRLEQGLWTALLDPIFGARGPVQELFESIVSPLQSIGRLIAANFVQPLITGVIEYFGIKTAQETLATQASVISQATAAAEIAGIHAATVGAMMPGLSAAATASLIATFGASASAAALLPGLLATGAAQGKALAAAGAIPTPFAEGGQVVSPTFALVGEDGAETIIPETRRGRALELLSDLFARRPELAAAAPGRAGGALSLTIQQFFSGDTDPEAVGEATISAIDRALGREFRAAI